MRDILDIIKEKVEQLLENFDDKVIATVLGFIFINVSLVVHEISHVIVARALGCISYLSSLNVYSGASYVSCTGNTLIITALAGPLGAFLYATYLWYFKGRDSIFRVAGLFSYVYSVLPSITPIRGSDMFIAINSGLSVPMAYLIFLSVSIFVMYNIFREVADRNNLF